MCCASLGKVYYVGVLARVRLGRSCCGHTWKAATTTNKSTNFLKHKQNPQKTTENTMNKSINKVNKHISNLNNNNNNTNFIMLAD